MVYFNYAGVARIRFGLWYELVRYLCHYYLLGVRSALLKYEKAIPLLAKELAVLLNCQPSEVTYLKNTTEGVILAAESLPLHPGDEILIMESDYPANLIPWLKKRDEGIRVTVLDGSNSSECYQNLLRAVSPQTKVIAVSWVQFSDGYQIDLPALSALCQKRGIFLIVDAVQIIGTRRVDLQEVRVDILMCGGQKHLMSTVGSGFVYIHKDTLPLLKNHKIGLRSLSSFDTEVLRLKETASRFEDGTPNLIGILGLYHQVRWINRIGIREIERRNLSLLKCYKEILRKYGLGFIDHEYQGNILSIPCKNPDQVAAELEKQGIYVKVIRGKFVRVSFSFLNSRRDILRFCRVFSNFYSTDTQTQRQLSIRAYG